MNLAIVQLNSSELRLLGGSPLRRSYEVRRRRMAIYSVQEFVLIAKYDSACMLRWDLLLQPAWRKDPSGLREVQRRSRKTHSFGLAARKLRRVTSTSRSRIWHPGNTTFTTMCVQSWQNFVPTTTCRYWIIWGNDCLHPRPKDPFPSAPLHGVSVPWSPRTTNQSRCCWSALNTSSSPPLEVGIPYCARLDTKCSRRTFVQYVAIKRCKNTSLLSHLWPRGLSSHSKEGVFGHDALLVHKVVPMPRYGIHISVLCYWSVERICPCDLHLQSTNDGELQPCTYIWRVVAWKQTITTFWRNSYHCVGLYFLQGSLRPSLARETSRGIYLPRHLLRGKRE